MAPALRISELRVSYGAIEAVKSIDLEVRAGELVALIGANGAGKTSSLKAIAGLLPWSGSIELFGEPIHAVPCPSAARARAGAGARGPWSVRRMTVAEKPADGRLHAARRADCRRFREDVPSASRG